MSAGTVFVELGLDYSEFEKGQYRLLKESEAAASTIEGNYKRLQISSDTMYQAMANRAILSYQAITKESQASAAEQFRAQSAMVAKINSLNMDAAKNPLYETLGLRSVAAINAQKSAVIASYETIKKSGTASAQDLINIEHAKNAKLKELNKEMVGDHEMSMASMTRAILRFYAAYYVVSAGVRATFDFVMSGIKSIDSLKTSTIAVAAQITSMQGPKNVLENYKNAVKYAESLNIKLMEIDANSFANYQQIQLMNRAMINQGVILDTNNAKQVESFTALTNAVALFTTGQDKERQASQEIRALMSGQIRAGDMVAMQMDALIKKEGIYKNGLKELVAEGKKHGDTLERMQPYLIGIVAASGDIGKTWEAVSSSMETAWVILQRSLFKDFYKDLVEEGMKAVAWIKENADEIASYIKGGFSVISNTVGAIWGVLKGFIPVLQDIAPLVGMIAYGWGGVLAALKPIGELLGNMIALAYNFIKLIAQGATATAAAMTGNMTVAVGTMNDAKKTWEEIKGISKDSAKIFTNGITDALDKYDKYFQNHQKKSAESISVPKVSPGVDDVEKKTDRVAEAASRLKEQWLDTARTLDAKISMDGINDLQKKLIQNQLEADNLKDKFKDLPKGLKIEAYAKIDKSKQIADDNAIHDAAIKNIKEIVDAREKAEKEAEQAAKEKLTVERSIYKDLRKYSGEYFEATKALINDQADQYRKVLVEKAKNAEEAAKAEVAIQAWVKEETINTYIEMGKKSDDYFDGLQAALEEIKRDAMTAGQAGYETTKEFADRSKDTLSDVLFDTYKGELKSFLDYWNSFCDAMMRKFFDICAQMVVEWIMAQAKMKDASSSGSGLSGMLGSLLGSVSSLFGGSNILDLSGSNIGAGVGANPAWGSANGNVFDCGNVIPFARGGIVDRPTIFPMAKGTGLMGEAGPEAVMPLKRTRSGKLGVEVEGGKSSNVIHIVNVSSPDQLDSYLATSRGQSAILNVISSRSGAVKRVLRG
jgi:hypothetical protein